jgi:hypothetical protein
MNTPRIVRLSIPILCAVALYTGFMLGLRRPCIPWTNLNFGMSEAEVQRVHPTRTAWVMVRSSTRPSANSLWGGWRHYDVNHVLVQGELFQADYTFGAAGLERVELWRNCGTVAEKNRVYRGLGDFLSREYGLADQFGHWHGPEFEAWFYPPGRLRPGVWLVSVTFYRR